MEFSEFKLWSEDQLLESININEVKDFVKKETTFWKNNDSSKIAKEWYLNFSPKRNHYEKYYLINSFL